MLASARNKAACFDHAGKKCRFCRQETMGLLFAATEEEHATLSEKEADEKSWEDASTTGLIKWWNLFLKDFPPALASGKTGIPEETIKRLAQELATTKPAIAQRGRGTTASGPRDLRHAVWQWLP